MGQAEPTGRHGGYLAGVNLGLTGQAECTCDTQRMLISPANEFTATWTHNLVRVSPLLWCMTSSYISEGLKLIMTSRLAHDSAACRVLPPCV